MEPSKAHYEEEAAVLTTAEQQLRNAASAIRVAETRLAAGSAGRAELRERYRDLSRAVEETIDRTRRARQDVLAAWRTAGRGHHAA